MGRRIIDLDEVTAPSSTDYAIVWNGGTTKKVQLTNLGDAIMGLDVFVPAGTVSLVASNVTQSAALNNGTNNIVRVAVTGSIITYIKFGNSGVTVNASDGIPLFPSEPELFDVGTATHVAVIVESGNSRINFTVGEGEL